jgi:hypothetical protein
MVKPDGTVRMICLRKCDGPLRVLFVTIRLKLVGRPSLGTLLGEITAV